MNTCSLLLRKVNVNNLQCTCTINFSSPFILTSNTITTFSLIDVSVQLLKYSVKVSTTLCRNSMTNSGGTETKNDTTDIYTNKDFVSHQFLLELFVPNTLSSYIIYCSFLVKYQILNRCFAERNTGHTRSSFK